MVSPSTILSTEITRKLWQLLVEGAFIVYQIE